MEFSELLSVFRDFGLPVALLIVIGFAIRSFCFWAAVKFEKYVEPIFARHMDLIEKIEHGMADQTEVLRHICEQLGFRK